MLQITGENFTKMFGRYHSWSGFDDQLGGGGYGPIQNVEGGLGYLHIWRTGHQTLLLVALGQDPYLQGGL